MRLSGGDAGAPFTFNDDGTTAIVTMPIGEDVRGKDVAFELSSTELTLGVKGNAPPAIDGPPRSASRRSLVQQQFVAISLSSLEGGKTTLGALTVIVGFLGLGVVCQERVALNGVR